MERVIAFQYQLRTKDSSLLEQLKPHTYKPSMNEATVSHSLYSTDEDLTLVISYRMYQSEEPLDLERFCVPINQWLQRQSLLALVIKAEVIQTYKTGLIRLPVPLDNHRAQLCGLNDQLNAKVIEADAFIGGTCQCAII